MIHEMKLQPEYYDYILNGTKRIEIRLYDEKRQQIQVGDIIEFTSRATGEVQKTKVIAMHIYSSFADLYRDYDKVSLGYGKDEEANPEDMELYYSKEEQEKYGVVGIEIELL